MRVFVTFLAAMMMGSLVLAASATADIQDAPAALDSSACQPAEVMPETNSTSLAPIRLEDEPAASEFVAAATDTGADATAGAAAAKPDSVPGPNPWKASAWRGTGRPNLYAASKHGLHAVVADMAHIYTAPIRMTWYNAALTAGVLGVGGALYARDQEVYEAFLDARGNTVYDAVIDVGTFFEPLGFMGETNQYYAGALVLGYVFDVPILRTIPNELLESHLIAGAFRQIGEVAVKRTRPFENKGDRDFSGGTSFPSGHASVIMEVASVLSHHMHSRIATVLLYGMAGAVCMQRVDDGTHWPSDVWMGASYGLFVSHQVTRRNDERRAGLDQGRWYDVTKRNPPKWSAMPVIAPGYTGLAFEARF